MEAAFVDVGLERAAFLHVSDIRPESLPENGLRLNTAITPGRSLPIWCARGQELVVQVIKDPIGTKGRAADHSYHPAVPLSGVSGRFRHGAGVSVKIDGERERQRLKEVVNAFPG
jgi:ribonuclease G